MQSRKGLEISALQGVALLVALLVGVAAGSMFLGDTEEAAATSAAAQGDIDTFQAVQEASGFNDLDVTEQDLNTTGLVDDGNAVAKTNLSGTNGDTHTFAAGVEVRGTGGIDNVETDVALNNASAFELREFYITEDVENNDYTERTQARHDLTSEIEDADTIDTELPNLASSEWIVVSKLKSIETGHLRADEDVISVDMEGDTEDSDDNADLHYTVDNVQ